MQSVNMPPTSVSKRDYFALITLQTLIAGAIPVEKNQAAAFAVDLADVLIAALSKPVHTK